MKIYIHTCPSCQGEYGVIKSELGKLISIQYCKCQIRRKIIHAVLVFIAVILLCWIILGGKNVAKDPVGGTSIEKTYTREFGNNH